MGLRNKGLEAGVAPLTIIPGNPLEGYLISSTLGSVDPEVLIPKKNSSTWEYNENPIKYMAMTAAQSFGVLTPRAKGMARGHHCSKGNWS